jgi:hypothetical protein
MIPNTREELVSEITSALGGNMIDIDLTPRDIDLAITFAFRRYRQRSPNANVNCFVFLDTQPGVQLYTLPNEIQIVKDIFRKGAGGLTAGAQIDPFSQAIAQNLFMVQNPGGGTTGGIGAGNLALFDFSVQYAGLIGRMFGRDTQFTWTAATHQLFIHRKFTGIETMGLECYAALPETVLLSDPYARPWLTSMSIAQAKLKMGEARATYGSYAGPQGGITLNGAELKSEALAEIEKLDKELSDNLDAGSSYGGIVWG